MAQAEEEIAVDGEKVAIILSRFRALTAQQGRDLLLKYGGNVEVARKAYEDGGEEKLRRCFPSEEHPFESLVSEKKAVLLIRRNQGSVELALRDLYR